MKDGKENQNNRNPPKMSHLRVGGRLIYLFYKIAPGHFFGTILLNLLTGILPAAVVIFWQRFFSAAYAVTETGWTQDARRDIILYLALIIAEHVTSLLVNQINNLNEMMTVEKVRISLLNEIHESLSLAPLERYENSAYGDQIFRANQVISRNQFTNTVRHMFLIIRNVLTVISTVSVLAAYHPVLVAVAAVSLLPSFVARLIRGEQFYMFQYYQAPKQRQVSYLEGLFMSSSVVKEMRVYGFQEWLLAKWHSGKDALDRDERRFSFRSGIIQFFYDFFRTAGYAVGVVIIFRLALKGSLAIGTVGAALIAMKSTQSAFMSVLMRFTAFIAGINNVRDLVSFIRVSPKQTQKQKPERKETESIKTVRLCHVSFCYPNCENKVLDDVNLTLSVGHSIAVVGENGAGKTTLAKLIMGLYQPTEGEILYNGKPIDAFGRDEVYRQTSVIFQDFLKYHTAYRYNIAASQMEDKDDDEKITAVMEKNNIGSLLEHFPQGLDTQIGVEFGGVDLSLGQWQKTGIARSMFRQAPMLVMDEPTASIDPIAENEIFHRFVEMNQGKLTMLITHRIGSARLTEQIVFLKNGKIAEMGTHRDLMERNGDYAKLFSLQAHWYLPEKPDTEGSPI